MAGGRCPPAGGWVIPCGAGGRTEHGSHPRGVFYREGWQKTPLFPRQGKKPGPVVPSSPPPSCPLPAPPASPAAPAWVPKPHPPHLSDSCPMFWRWAGERGGHQNLPELTDPSLAPSVPGGEQSPPERDECPYLGAQHVQRPKAAAGRALPSWRGWFPSSCRKAGAGKPIPTFIWQRC